MSTDVISAGSAADVVDLVAGIVTRRDLVRALATDDEAIAVSIRSTRAPGSP